MRNGAGSSFCKRDKGSKLRISAGRLAVLAGVLFAISATRAAHGQDVDRAPGVNVKLLRNAAVEELEVALVSLAREGRLAPVGVYVAFDTSRTDVSAMVGCDDDGDYVVVLSDALLSFASFVAEAEATDETFGTHKVEQYARFLADAEGGARSTTRARPLPPPPGFYELGQARAPRKLALERARFSEIVASVVAHELGHLLAAELTCSNPTATHEIGDDEWTADERAHALDAAGAVYAPESVASADAFATTLLLETGRTERGSIAWLRTIEHEGASTYLRLHRGKVDASRSESVRQVAEAWRRVRTTIPLQFRPTESRVAPQTNSMETPR
jgi:hypothetical protein